jgi:hypothetical protein
VEGRDAIIARNRVQLTKWEATQHFTRNPVIRVDRDRADASFYTIAQHTVIRNGDPVTDVITDNARVDDDVASHDADSSTCQLRCSQERVFEPMSCRRGRQPDRAMTESRAGDRVRVCLDGDVVVVTGAGRGIGRATAIALAARAATVVVNDRPGNGDAPSGADDVVSEIRRNHGRAVADYTDVATLESAGDVVTETRRQLGRLDGLVCNAGITGNQRPIGYHELQEPGSTSAYVLSRV